TAPQRRVDKTLRYFAQGAYRKSFHSKKGLAQALAEEILAAYHGSQDSTALREKERIEREASGAR
ncbi:MAG: 30S ribosomal protein S7, partial [Candidatus Aenigmarchaeota archaeon]|nr:30S ribosomal protein S7 [Candidatus Aenigmarchaeota archaeon]